MQSFLDYVIKGLVDHPEEVRITPVERAEMILYELQVHPGDVGKIIGKQGSTIHAIRALLQVAGAKKGQRCSLEIVEDRPSTG
jgi:predicted RNA-binding protein YlqC (UPF0109 family)